MRMRPCFKQPTRRCSKLVAREIFKQYMAFQKCWERNTWKGGRHDFSIYSSTKNIFMYGGYDGPMDLAGFGPNTGL